MPVSYRIDDELKVVVTTIEGVVNAEELRQHALGLSNDPQGQGLDELVDLSNRDTVTSSAEALRSMASLFREQSTKRPKRKKLALVAANDAVFGMARLYAAHREDATIEVQVFRQRQEALEWLGVDPPRRD